MKYLFLILFCSFSILAQVEDEIPDSDLKKFLIVESFESNDLVPSLVSQINKSVLMISSKQKDYSLILSSLPTTEVAAVTYQVRLLLYKKKEYFEIEAQLVDLNSEKIYRRVRKDKILKSKLILNVEKALSLLFEFQTEAKVRTKKTKKIIDKNEIDFRKRILSLKQGVQNKIAAKNREKSRKNDLGNLIKNNAQEAEEDGKYIDTYFVGASYKQLVVNSSDVVEIRNSLNLLNIDLGARRDFLSIFYIDGEVQYGKIITSSELNFPSYLKAEIMPGFFLARPYLSISGGFSYENFFFSNVSAFGQGIEVVENKVFWLDVQPKLTLPLSRLSLILFSRFSNSLNVSSSYSLTAQNDSFKGDKVLIGFGIDNFLKLVNFAFKFERINIVSDGDSNVSSNSSSYSYHFSYIF